MLPPLGFRPKRGYKADSHRGARTPRIFFLHEREDRLLRSFCHGKDRFKLGLEAD